MYAREEIHPGLLVVPGGPGRDGQQQLARTVIQHSVASEEQVGEPPADFMVNKLVEIDENGHCTIQDLP